jgi:opacity protein-like surface antigen
MRSFRSKQAILVIALISLFLLATPAATSAQTVGSSYLGFSAGAVFFRPNEIRDHELDFDPGFAVSGIAGYIFGSVRLEGELSYSETDLQFGDRDEELTILRGATSLHFDFIGFGSSNILPYVGVGMGLASLEFHDEINDSDVALTAHGEIGVSLAAASSFDVYFSYRFEHFNADISAASKDFQSHQVRLGLRLF